MGAMTKVGFNDLHAEDQSADTSKGPGADGLGRPVRVASIGFKGGAVPLEKMASLVDEEGARGADVIVLPELCRGMNDASEEPLHGPTITAMSGLAKKAQDLCCCSY
jgi:hypothetical protein